jgi:hypothetical protein
MARLVLVLSLLFSSAAVTWAQEQPKPNVTISFRSLGTGAPTVLARPRHFVPITVVLENGGANDADGLLRVYRSQYVQAGVAFSSVPEQGLFYERNVKIPSHGKRIEELYYYCQDGEPDRVCVAFEMTGGETIVAAPHPKLDLRTSDLLALSVTRTNNQDDAVALGGGIVPGPRRPYELAVKHGDPVALPERPEGYGAFDLVILSDLDPRSVSLQQTQALKQWVEQGGDLLVCFSGNPGDVLDDALLPVTAATGADATTSLDLHSLEPLVPDAPPMERARTTVLRVLPKPGARVLAGTAANPLIVRGRLGAGRVTYFAFQLAALKSCWGTDKGSGGKTILGLAAHPPYEDLESMQPPPSAPPLEEVLLNLSEALKTLQPPSALIVAPLLILYVTLVAPLNYLVLTRLGKRDLAMASAAAIAIVFGVLFYGIGWYVHGSGSLVARAALVELPESPDQRARIDTMTGFFSTDRGNIGAKAAKGSSIAPIAERATGRGGHVIEAAGADPYLKAVELDTWSLRRFKSTRLESVGAVVADLHYNGNKVVGTVENKTSWTLETPVILVGKRMIELTDMKAGAKVMVDETPKDVPTHGGFALDQRMLRGLEPGAFKARYNDTSSYALGGDPYGNDSNARFRATLERRVRAMNAGPEAVPALFACCVERDLGGVDMDVSASLELQRALVLSELVVTAPGQDVQLRDLGASVHYAKNYDAIAHTTGSPARLSFNNGTQEHGVVAYEWRLPASHDLPLQARRLEIGWALETDAVEEDVVLALYDYSLQKYQARHRLKGREGSWADDKNLAKYIDPESGLVRVMIDSAMQEVLVKDVWLTFNGVRVPREK